MKNELKTSKDIKTYSDFIEYFHIKPILNNYIYDYAIMNNSDCHYINWNIDYYTPDGDVISEEELNELESNGIDTSDYEEVETEIYQYYIVTSYDAETIQIYTNDKLIYIPELDLNLWCIEHYGTSWDCVPIELKL